MKKFLLLIIALSMTIIINAADKKAAKVLWEKKPDKNYWYNVVEQDLSSDNFKVLEINGSLNSANSANIIDIDVKGNSRKEELKFNDKNASNKYKGSNYTLHFFSNRYYIKEFTKKVEFYDSNNKMIFTQPIGVENIERTYISEKYNLLYIDYFFTGKKNSIAAFDINSGEKKFTVEYLIKKDKHRAKFYFDDNRLVIYENGKDLSIFSLSDGKFINKIENFAINADSFEFYETDKDVYFLSIDSFYIGFLSLDTGRLISSIRYRDKASIWSLKQIGVKKINGLYYLFLNCNNANDSSIICIDSGAGKIVWEKKLKTNVIEYYEHEKNFLVSDENFAYCIEKSTGREIWKSEKFKEIYDSGFIKNVFVVKVNKQKEFYAYEPKTGAIKWSLKLDQDYISLHNSDDKFLFVSDKSNVYKIDFETGKILWQNTSYKNIVNTYYYKKEKKIFAIYNKKRGVTEFDYETGRSKWEIDTKFDLTDILVDEQKAYFADKKNIYGINLQTSEIFAKNEIKFSGNISAIAYLKGKNKFVLFDYPKSLYLYDLSSNQVSKKVNYAFWPFHVELKTIGDYLVITEINLAVSSPRGGTTPGTTVLTMVNINSADVYYTLEIGKHYYTSLGVFKKYYDKFGAYQNFKELGGNTNELVFYPRKEYYKDNILIVHNPWKSTITAYELFPERVPTAEDLKKMEKYFISFSNF